MRAILDAAKSRIATVPAAVFPPRAIVPAGDDRAHVLVTGAAGLVGSIVVRGLDGQRCVHGIDRRHGHGVSRVVDLRHPRAMARVFDGIDCVVHLAADPRPTATWRSVMRNNVEVTVNTFEAARRAGVRRVVFASSNHVVGLYERDEPYASIVAGRYDGLEPGSIAKLGSEWPARPDGPYAVSKAFGEAVGRFYAEVHGLSVICLRLGTVNRADRPLDARQRATLLTHGDLMRLVECSLEAPPGLRFVTVFGVSANRWRFWDLENARRELGFEPRDDAAIL